MPAFKRTSRPSCSSVTNVPSLSAASFRCLLGHPSLAELFAYVGKETVNAEVKRMFPGIAR